MWNPKPQKIYNSEEDRRRDQGNQNEPDEGILGAFNNAVCEWTQGYRRNVSRNLARIETDFEQAGQSENAEKLKAMRLGFKVGYCDHALKETCKAIKADARLKLMNLSV